MEHGRCKEILYRECARGTQTRPVHARPRLRAVAGQLERALSRLTRQGSAQGEEEIWLLDNASFLRERICAVSRALPAQVSPALWQSLEALIAEEEPLGRELVAVVLDVLTAREPLSEEQLESFLDLFSAVCLCALGVRLQAGERMRVSDLVLTLRMLSEEEMSRYLTAYSPLERVLSSDPTGAYAQMEYAFRLRVRQAVRRAAHRAKQPPLSFAQGLLSRARETGAYIGAELERPPRARGIAYGVLTLVCSLLLGALFSALLLSADAPFGLALGAGFLLSGQGAAFAASAFFSSLFSYLLRPRALYRIEFSRLPRRCRTLVVFPVLATGAEQITRAVKALEETFFASFVTARGEENLYFSLLLDLKGAKTPTLPQDEALYRLAQKGIEELNSRHADRFLLFVRPRRKNADGEYIGWERKRGALLSLCAFLRGRESEIVCRTGCEEAVKNVKYVMTLDADTRICPLGIQQLVGILEHPLYRPELSYVRGTPVITRGSALVQPLIVPSALCEKPTYYSVTSSGGGAMSAYSAPAFEQAQTLFSRGKFCGKGLFCLELYDTVLQGAFPENAVLSHDLLEGARLGCMTATDLCFTDEPMREVHSADAREHRWCRGDVQALFFAFGRARAADGRRHANPIAPFYRVALFENLARILVPVCSSLLLLLSLFCEHTASRVFVLAALLPYAAPYVIDVGYLLLSSHVSALSRKFFSSVTSGAWVRTFSLLYDWSALFYTAYRRLDAILRALYRMLVSGRRRLEWRTAASSTSRARGGALFYLRTRLIAPIAGLFLLALGQGFWVRVVGLLSLLHPVLCALLARPVRSRERVSAQSKQQLVWYARDMARFLLSETGEGTNFLPPDHVVVAPVRTLATRTSPTNIGLYLASLCAMVDLKILTEDECLSRMERCVETVSRLETWHGLLYNWYDTGTLQVLPPAYVSSVDCGNFAVCLSAVEGFLSERPSTRGGALSLRIKALRLRTNLRLLYDKRRELFFIGYHASRGCPDTSHYDLYMSEARMTSFYAVAQGLVPPRHFAALSRPLISRGGYLGLASFSGTAFEYFMPALFLPVFENCMEDEACRFAALQQRRRAQRSVAGPLFGVSESSVFANSAEVASPYRANGIVSLSLNRRATGEDVISPYSSFLMLAYTPRAALGNLARLQRAGMYGEYGFYESATVRAGELGIVHSFFAHHVGMSLIAAANAVTDGAFRRRFLSDPAHFALRGLLCEKICTDAPLRRPPRTQSPVPRAPRTRVGSRSAACVVPARQMTLTSDGCGYVGLLYRGGREVSCFAPVSQGTPPRGLVLRVQVGEHVYSTVPEENPAGTQLGFYREEGGFCVRLFSQGESVTVRFALSGTHPVLSVSTAVYPARHRVTVALSFYALLCREGEYFAHPAFCNLSLSGAEEADAFVYTRRAKTNERPLSLAVCELSEGQCQVPEHLVGQELAGRGGARALLTAPPVSGGQSAVLPSTQSVFLHRSDGGARGGVRHQFLLAVAETQGQARALLRDEAGGLTSRSPQTRDASGYEARALSASGLKTADSPLCREVTRHVLHARRMRLVGELNAPMRREELYALGISGDLPIVLCRVRASHKEAVRTLAALRRYHAIAGLEYDLVLCCERDGYLRRAHNLALEAVSAAGAEYLLGRRGGIFLCEEEQRRLMLLNSAACITVEHAGQLFCHFEEKPPIARPSTAPTSFSLPPVRARAGTSGAFCGESFVISRDCHDPVEAHAHLMASPTFGALVTHRSLGYTFETSSRLRRISRPLTGAYEDGWGERLLLRDESGRTYDLAACAARVSFSPFCARYFGTAGQLEYALTVFVHPTLLFRGVSLELCGRGEVQLSYDLIPVLGDEVGTTGAFYSHLDSDLLVFTRAISPISRPFSGYLLVPGAHLARAEERMGVRLHSELSSRLRVNFYLGSAASERQLSAVCRYLRETPFLKLFTLAVSESRSALAPQLLCRCADGAAEHFLSTWLGYQVLVSRLYARCGLYQSGGAWGFRDQLQDALLFLHFDPARTRRILLSHAAHQFAQGDVLHWWHNVSEHGAHRGVRTRISDDLLWLVYATCTYAEKTDDLDCLFAEVPFLEGEELSAGQRERYSAYRVGEKAPLWRHLTAAADLVLARGTGRHGLCLMLSGDWNDGFDRFDEGSESMFLTQFSAVCLQRLSQLLLRLGKGEEAAHYATAARRLYEATQDAPHTRWFARAYFGDGTPLGDDVTLRSPCSIDLLVQCFSAFAYLSRPRAEQTQEALGRVICALDAAWEHLYDPRSRILKLFTPPFSGQGREVGYIRGYVSGVRENGGQYTHAAVWYAFACRAIAEKTEDAQKWRRRADETAFSLLPSRAASDARVAERYRLEPYALCGDVYSAEGFEGRGGWSHYTGSAAWLWRYFHAPEDPRGI